MSVVVLDKGTLSPRPVASLILSFFYFWNSFIIWAKMYFTLFLKTFSLLLQVQLSPEDMTRRPPPALDVNLTGAATVRW